MLNDKLQELQNKATALREEAKSLDTERAGLDSKKDAKRIGEINDREPRLHEEVKTVLEERKVLETEIKAQNEFRKDLDDLENFKSVNLQRDTRTNIKGSNAFNLDRCVAIHCGKGNRDGIEAEYMSDQNIMRFNGMGEMCFSAQFTRDLYEQRRDSTFSLAGQESTFHSTSVTTPTGLAMRLGASIKFVDMVGVASAIDFFAGAATGTNTATAQQATEFAHRNKPIPVQAQRAAVDMNLSSVTMGGRVSSISEISTAAQKAINK